MKKIFGIVQIMFKGFSFYVIEILMHIIFQLVFTVGLVVFDSNINLANAIEVSNNWSAKYNTYLYMIILAVSLILFSKLYHLNLLRGITDDIRNYCWKKGLICILLGSICSVMANLIIVFANPDSGEIYKMQTVEFCIYAIGLVLLIPIVEEVVFRRILFKELSKEMNIYAGIVLSSFAFFAFHGICFENLYTFFMGVIFSSIYNKHNNFCSTVVLHITFNMVALLISIII